MRIKTQFHWTPRTKFHLFYCFCKWIKCSINITQTSFVYNDSCLLRHKHEHYFHSISYSCKQIFHQKKTKQAFIKKIKTKYEIQTAHRNSLIWVRGKRNKHVENVRRKLFFLFFLSEFVSKVPTRLYKTMFE